MQFWKSNNCMWTQQVGVTASGRSGDQLALCIHLFFVFVHGSWFVVNPSLVVHELGWWHILTICPCWPRSTQVVDCGYKELPQAPNDKSHNSSALFHGLIGHSIQKVAEPTHAQPLLPTSYDLPSYVLKVMIMASCWGDQHHLICQCSPLVQFLCVADIMGDTEGEGTPLWTLADNKNGRDNIELLNMIDTIF